MVELDQFLTWCDIQYTNTPHCRCGLLCTNSSYCQGSQADCYACIQRVHSYHNRTIHYNCDKMLLYYVLKHTYRFGAEVFYLLGKLRKDITNWQSISIASIGCGPCSELFGALSLWRTLGKGDVNFHFRGFDTEPLWQPIMNQLAIHFNAMDVHIYGQDAFAYYRLSREEVDIVILNYMLSDMCKFNQNLFQGFLADLITLIRQKRPKYLLINDVYLRISLQASSDLISALKRAGVAFLSWKGQYHYFNPLIGQWGEQMQKHPFAMTNATIVSNYQPFPEVNGIQTIIKFQ